MKPRIVFSLVRFGGAAALVLFLFFGLWKIYFSESRWRSVGALPGKGQFICASDNRLFASTDSGVFSWSEEEERWDKEAFRLSPESFLIRGDAPAFLFDGGMWFHCFAGGGCVPLLSFLAAEYEELRLGRGFFIANMTEWGGFLLGVGTVIASDYLVMSSDSGRTWLPLTGTAGIEAYCILPDSHRVFVWLERAEWGAPPEGTLLRFSFSGIRDALEDYDTALSLYGSDQYSAPVNKTIVHFDGEFWFADYRTLYHSSDGVRWTVSASYSGFGGIKALTVHRDALYAIADTEDGVMRLRLGQTW